MTLSLQPMDSPQPAAPAPKAAAEIEIVPLGTTMASQPAPADKTERFLREATHQYAEGHLDQLLWDRAFAQAKGDKEAAVDTYLHARAIALRLLDRERRSETRAVAARAVVQEMDKATDVETMDADETLRFGRSLAFARNRYAIIAGVILVIVAVGGWQFNSYRNAAPTDASAITRAAPGGGSPMARVPAATAAANDTGPVPAPKQVGASAELMKKIQDLRDAGSSNVLVFYLVEWTRKEPTNPEAWDQLRVGYVTLKQYDDALGAAKKAQEFATDDPRMWRNLGNDRDAESFKQIGILNARMSQLPEAGRAFDSALAISPGDPTALCMRSGVAQLAAVKDTYAIAKQVKVIDTQCHGS